MIVALIDFQKILFKNPQLYSLGYKKVLKKVMILDSPLKNILK